MKPSRETSPQAVWSSFLRHLRNYRLVNLQALRKGISPWDLMLLKFPLHFADAHRPPLLSVDITDACNLECRYCNNPHFPHPRTMMSEATFARLLMEIKAADIHRVRIGGGEPTLHPQFAEFLTDIARSVKFLSIVTNAQWKDPAIGEKLLATGIDLIEVSVDAGGAEVYEGARKNANYALLIENLKHLREIRDRQHYPAVLKVRLMLRPSTRHREAQETAFLEQYCDCVLPQFVVQHPEVDRVEDVYLQKATAAGHIPVCTIPFKDLQVRPNGDIPICPAKGCRLDPAERVFVGNILNDSILSVWRGSTMRKLRRQHRLRSGEILEGCRECHYG